MRFRTWLLSQTRRSDSIGKLAQYYQSDSGKPVSPNDYKLYLYLRKQTKGQPELQKGAVDAWNEFQLEQTKTQVET